MLQRVTSRLPRTSLTQTRAAVLAAGMGATVVLGVGAAAAAENTAAPAAATAQAQAAAKKATASWVSPVKSYKLSASFAQNGGMWAHKHSGQDYAVPT
ncbi:M23 family peptidase, partial [Streptomyces sp. NPDC000931]